MKQDSILSLEYPDNVRKRYGMYGGDSSDSTTLLREIIDNSLDEGIKYNGLKHIFIHADPEFGYVIADDGRGIPISMSESHPDKTQLELAMCNLHAGSNFEGTTASIGLNGVGASVVNAVSDRFIVASRIKTTNHDTSDPCCLNHQGDYFYIHCEKGILISKGVVDNFKLDKLIGMKIPVMMNTVTYFLPDLTVLESRSAVPPMKSMRTYNFILNKVYNRNVTITYNGEVIPVESGFYKHAVEGTIPVSGKYNKSIRFYINFEFDKDLSVTKSRGSVNTLIVNRGIHISESRSLIKSVLKSYFSIDHNLTDPGLKVFAIMIGIEPKYTSQTKENLSGMDGYKVGMISALRKSMHDYIAAHDKEFRLHVDRLNLMDASSKKASKLSAIKSILKQSTKVDANRYKASVPSNIKDCIGSNRKNTELFIVEGDSAGGSLMKVRDINKHALFFLTGKPLNSVGLNIEATLANKEMNSLAKGIGLGVNGYHQLKNLRYGKIIILADADPDGASIAALLVGFFCKHMTFAIKAGLIYVCETPIYIQGDKYIYPSDPPSALDRTKEFKHIKGLGELPSYVVKDVILNENKRRVRRITADNIAGAMRICTSGLARKQLMIDNGILMEGSMKGDLIAEQDFEYDMEDVEIDSELIE